MARSIFSSLKVKLVLLLAIFSLAQVLTLGYLAFDIARTGFEEAEFEKLYSERELRKGELLSYLKDTMQNLKFMAQTEFVASAMDTLDLYHKYNKFTPDSLKDSSSSMYKTWYNSVDPFFRSFIETHPPELFGYQDILITDASESNIMYTSKQLKDLGANIKGSDLKDSGLGQLWAKVIESKQPAMVDFQFYEPCGGPAAFMGFPIGSKDGGVKGVLILRLGAQKIARIFQPSHEGGGTTRAYLVGQDYLLRSQAGDKDKQKSLNTKVDTEAARKALAGEPGTGIVKDHLGNMVLSSYSRVGLKDEGIGADFTWVVLAEADTGDAFAPVRSLQTRIGLIALCIALISFVVAFIVSGNVTKPLAVLAERVSEAGKGDLTTEIPWQARKDEIGTLAKAFDTMLEDLRSQTRQLLDGVDVVINSAAEISSTASQLSASTSRTSSAISETTVTVQQVKQSAATANEKARNVAETSQKAARISDNGLTATRETIEGMKTIKEQMASIGDTVIKLSKESQAIENIIATVQDLADQSNLLAVNASIEAARAGDYGKGFSVVAHEIKTLADQSKEATGQVRSILENTRKWVNAVVMAAEEGGKAVEAGVEKSTFAGEAIEALVEGVSSSVEAANVIEVSSEQQAHGVDQVAGAMQDIEESVHQNSQGAAQLERAADRLQDLGEQLRQSVSHYRV